MEADFNLRPPLDPLVSWLRAEPKLNGCCNGLPVAIG
jgi:hypothetical protein